MSANSEVNSFLTEYICSLLERTRDEKSGLKLGIDWLIYQLGTAKGWNPFRLPFYRWFHSVASTAKVEPEGGEDMSFVTGDGNELIVFVLKDEKLTYKNWISHDFCADMQRAVSPDLNRQGLENVKNVRIILAYNKDEDNAGVAEYDKFVANIGNGGNRKTPLGFDRWNLSVIVKEVAANLMNADLLPQHLAGLFRYTLSQAEDFEFESEQWQQHLVPDWLRFLDSVLVTPVDERRLRLVPVVLLILQETLARKNNKCGWFDLTEWAMVKLWRVYKGLEKDSKLRGVIVRIWLALYIAELEKYILDATPAIETLHGLSRRSWDPFGQMTPVNDAYVAFWYLGRIGIFTLAAQEVTAGGDDSKWMDALVDRSSGLIVAFLHSNPGALRPLGDLNHIELFLVWLVLWQARRTDDIYGWLSELESRLAVRRFPNLTPVPFIETYSRLDLVVEHTVTGQRPLSFCDSSSYLVLMLIELAFSLEPHRRDELVRRYLTRIVKGQELNGAKLSANEINLQSWSPPDDWKERILDGRVDKGVAVTTNNFRDAANLDQQIEEIRVFVDSMRQQFPWDMPDGIPNSVLILACIKHKSPLPPEYWRRAIFPVKKAES